LAGCCPNSDEPPNDGWLTAGLEGCENKEGWASEALLPDWDVAPDFMVGGVGAGGKKLFD
jgi:hypothetical protein